MSGGRGGHRGAARAPISSPPPSALRASRTGHAHPSGARVQLTRNSGASQHPRMAVSVKQARRVGIGQVCQSRLGRERCAYRSLAGDVDERFIDPDPLAADTAAPSAPWAGSWTRHGGKHVGPTLTVTGAQRIVPNPQTGCTKLLVRRAPPGLRLELAQHHQFAVAQRP